MWFILQNTKLYSILMYALPNILDINSIKVIISIENK